MLLKQEFNGDYSPAGGQTDPTYKSITPVPVEVCPESWIAFSHTERTLWSISRQYSGNRARWEDLT